MKKVRRMLVISLICFSAISAANPAAFGAARGSERTENLTYNHPALGLHYPNYRMPYVCGTGCLRFEVEAGDRYVSLEAQDAVASNVPLAIFLLDGEEDGETYRHYAACTATRDPVPIPRWAKYVWVEILLGACRDGTPATPTRGELRATFSTQA